jgi:hypothetical protein
MTPPAIMNGASVVSLTIHQLMNTTDRRPSLLMCGQHPITLNAYRRSLTAAACRVHYRQPGN